MAVQLLQDGPVRYPLGPQTTNDFLPDIAVLNRLATDRTNAMIVNSPSNPRGAVLTAEVAEAPKPPPNQ